jgi:hypothetical protein
MPGEPFSEIEHVETVATAKPWIVTPELSFPAIVQLLIVA